MSRTADYPIAPFLLARHSRVALSGAEVDQATLLQLFEAARWAPSASNSQPWRFLYALAGTDDFAAYFDLLVPFNQAWARPAGALILALSQSETEEGKAQPWHAFDTGAAWMSLALQASHLGLVCHAMGGFDKDKARRVLGIPQDYAPQVMIAVGHPGRTEDLPEAHRSRDTPNQRGPIATRIHAGVFPPEGFAAPAK